MSSTTTAAWRMLAGGTLLAATLMPVSVISAAHGQSAASCDGQRATVVGGDGTSGDDVMVTDGATDVRGRGGDDRICVTGRYDVRAISIKAGGGSDRVFTGRQDDVVVRLGAGADFSRGQAGPTVYGNGDPVSAHGHTTTCCLDSETEDIVALGRYAEVIVGDGGVLRDRIRLSGGPFGTGAGGLIRVRADRMASSASIDGGAGTMLIIDPGTNAGSWRADNRAGTLRTGGSTRFTWRGVSVLDWRSRALLSYRGKRAPEMLVAPRADRVSMGDGDDHVLIKGFDGSGARSFDGGAGIDTGYVAHTGDVAVDQRKHRITFEGGRARSEVLSVENWNLSTRGKIDFTGSGRGQRIGAWGCVVRVDAGGGDDVVTLTMLEVPFAYYESMADGYFPFLTKMKGSCADASYTLVGGGGNDDLTTFDGDSVLSGGAGDDLIFGSLGDDVITGGTGDDRITASAGDDEVDGGNGADNIKGGPGNDVLYGRSGGNVIDGSKGVDTCGGSGTIKNCER